MQYDNWNPELNPPKWYTCLECNGMGYGPYTNDCGACDGSGIKIEWIRKIVRLYSSLYWYFKHLKNKMHDHRPIRRCTDCDKIKFLFGHYVGNHDKCIPF